MHRYALPYLARPFRLVPAMQCSPVSPPVSCAMRALPPLAPPPVHYHSFAMIESLTSDYFECRTVCALPTASGWATGIGLRLPGASIMCVVSHTTFVHWNRTTGRSFSVVTAFFFAFEIYRVVQLRRNQNVTFLIRSGISADELRLVFILLGVGVVTKSSSRCRRAPSLSPSAEGLV